MAGRRDEGGDEVRSSAADRSSGAAEVLRRAAAGIAALPRPGLDAAVRVLVRGQPSMAPLWRLGSEALGAEDHAAAAVAFLESAAEADRAAAAAVRALLDDEVITHSWSSTVMTALDGAAGRVWCARSEPGGEGVRMARRLSASGAAAAVIPDDEALARAAAGGTVVVGADAVGPAGVVNKVGTGRLAAAATAAGGRALVVAGAAKLVAADVPAPAPFERVPIQTFTAVVTGDGPVDPAGAIRLTRGFPLHPLLRAELRAML